MKMKRITNISNSLRVWILVCMFVATVMLVVLAPCTSAQSVAGKIAFSSNRDGNGFEIYTMYANGAYQTRITNSIGYNNILPDFSPDGSHIVFYSDRSGTAQIYVMNSDGTNQTRLTSNTLVDRGPRFSPDGSRIVFSRGNDPNGTNGSSEIFIMNADGSNQIHLTNNVLDDGGARFSPDGGQIVFTRRSGPPDRVISIFIMSADGSGQTRLTNPGPSDDFNPSFSPDGSQIVFGSTRGSTAQGIFIMSAGGSIPIRLSPAGVDDEFPSFSRDGASIAFGRNGFAIFTMNSDGTNPVQRTSSNYFFMIMGDWKGSQPAPTVTISGRVRTPDGRGLRNATASITDSFGVSRTATTSSFGFFSFDNVVTGDTYTFRISSRLFRFTPQTVQVNDNLTLADFVGLE